MLAVEAKVAATKDGRGDGIYWSRYVLIVFGAIVSVCGGNTNPTAVTRILIHTTYDPYSLVRSMYVP